MNPVLVAFVGLPATGKSSLAAATGATTGWPVVSTDMVIATAGGMLTPHPAGIFAAADLVATNIADRHLDAGQSVILDSVAAEADTRAEWYEMAAIYDAPFRVIWCVCADAALHRARLLARGRHHPARGRHHPAQTNVVWAGVAQLRETYTPWGPDALTLDAARPFGDNLRAALAFIGAET